MSSSTAIWAAHYSGICCHLCFISSCFDVLCFKDSCQAYVTQVFCTCDLFSEQIYNKNFREMKRVLFEDSSENEEEQVNFKTNEEYAKSYNKFRQKELLKKLKDREGSTSDSDISSESDYSDEELVNNPEFDREFLKTLSSLKSKDPKIYDKNVKFFDDEEIDVKPKSKNDDNKAFTLKDYERKVIIEKEGRFEDEDEDSDGRNRRPASPSFAEEERNLKEEFKKALKDSDESDEDDFGGIFKKREKTKEEKDKEEAQYLEWLAGKKEDISSEVKQTLDPLKNYWDKPDLPKQEKFLRDYILNSGYVEKLGSEVPTYEEIVGDDNLSEDEKELEKQAEFEQKYNFRFEEPDKEFIKRYPRTIESSLRQKDDKRKRKRDELKERKLREKQEKYKEIEMLKELKRKEIEEKIQKLKEVTGNEDLPFQDEDLEEEFDPDAHDRKMRDIFNDEYYQIDEGEEKPECPDIEDLKVEDWDNFDPNADEDDDRYNYEPHCEDEDFNMDCDYDSNEKQSFQNELIENTKDRRKRRKRRNRFMEMIKTEKPPFNPEDEKSYGEYIDEYYKMDCEDIIGDTPCRFKYVETTPNDFGLSIEEILLAKTKELNQWASLKKAVQIRPEHDEKRDIKLFKMKAKNEALKRKIFVSLYGPQSEDEEDKKEERNKNTSENQNPEQKSKKKKKRRGNNDKASGTNGDNDKNVVASATVTVNNEETTTEPAADLKSEQNINKSDSPNTKTNYSTNQKNSSEKYIQEDNSKQAKLKSKKTFVPPKSDINVKTQGPTNRMASRFKTGSKNPFKQSPTEITDERLKAYGINPRKYHKKQKYEKIMKNKNKSKKNR